MSRYTFALATPADDAQLRARMAMDRMEGAIAVSFRREPSYFDGCCVQGDTTQVVKCVDGESGALAGLGSRSTALAYVDGESRKIGYLSDLRVAPEYRHGTLLARGYRYFRDLHDADPVPFYTTMIYEGNAPALGTLMGGRAGLPHYRDWGRFLTPALHLDFRVKPAPVAGVSVERGSNARLGEIVSFLNRWQSSKQFAPVYREGDFPHGRFRGLRGDDFYLAMRHGRIAGTIAVWDQSALRQTHVERYSHALAFLRPAYNVLAMLVPRWPLKSLPAPGERIPGVYLACLATEEDDVNVFRHLLCAVHEDIRRGPWHFAIAGLHETDPRAAVLMEMRRIPAAGRLCAVHFADQPLSLDPLEKRVPYLEAGCL